jgi:hypothetical protein
LLRSQTIVIMLGMSTVWRCLPRRSPAMLCSPPGSRAACVAFRDLHQLPGGRSGDDIAACAIQAFGQRKPPRSA